MKNKLQYLIELNRVKLFYKIWIWLNIYSLFPEHMYEKHDKLDAHADIFSTIRKGLFVMFSKILIK